jgi:hypothetical protein
MQPWSHHSTGRGDGSRYIIGFSITGRRRTRPAQGEVEMRLRAIVLALLSLTTVSFQSRAVTTYSSSFLEKRIATATIPDRNDMVLYFSVVVGTFKGTEIHGVAVGDGIYYQLTGTSKFS